MEDSFAKKIDNLYEIDGWREILSLDVDLEDESVRSLLWAWPSLENLQFIESTTAKLGLRAITSIGCGCGLFEWLLERSTDLEVVGVEVDRSWWTSKYARRAFVPLLITGMPPGEKVPLGRDRALLFCYFNNGDAFREYISIYKGALVFIVGPGKKRGTRTNPEPFSPDFGSDCWKLRDHQKIRGTEDYIAVYVKIL